MREAQKLQQGQAAQPQNRLPPCHKQPLRVRAQGCDRQEKGPERPAQPMRSAIRDGEAAQIGEAQRSGQLARLTEEIRAQGRGSSCCEDDSSDGGGWPPPQQPCSQHLYNAGRVRLPGVQGLDDASHPGRRRAKARGVREARSFGSLQFDGDQFSKAPIVHALEPATRGSINRTNPISRRNRAAAAHRLRRFVPDTDVGSEVSNGWP